MSYTAPARLRGNFLRSSGKGSWDFSPSEVAFKIRSTGEGGKPTVTVTAGDFFLISRARASALDDVRLTRNSAATPAAASFNAAVRPAHQLQAKGLSRRAIPGSSPPAGRSRWRRRRY